MPDLRDLRNYFKKEDAKVGDIITFVNEGEIKDVDFSLAKDGSNVKRVLQLIVELPDGSNKSFIPNANTRATLAEHWGSNTKSWEGKKAKVTFVPMMAFGKKIDALVLEPVVE